MNDLWEFTPSSSQWTWMGGATTAGQSGVYGTIGIRGSSNFPGGRAAGAAWYTSGTAYLYGGFGVDAAGVYQPMNDLWLRK